MKDNRTEVRFDICLTARWQGSGTHQNVRISDLSENGCYVDSIVEVSKGETLLLQILLPDGRWFELQGMVAHHSPRLGFGVRFVNLDEAQRRQILSLIDQANPSQNEQTESSWPLEQTDVTCHHVM